MCVVSAIQSSLFVDVEIMTEISSPEQSVVKENPPKKGFSSYVFQVIPIITTIKLNDNKNYLN